MPSIEYLPRYGLPDATSGHPGLGHHGDLNGSLRAIPWRMRGPGFSSTFTVVPFGPLAWATANLSLLARVDSLVTGTLKVAVAPSFLNQEFFVSFLYLRPLLLTSIQRSLQVVEVPEVIVHLAKNPLSHNLSCPLAVASPSDLDHEPVEVSKFGVPRQRY